MQTHRLDIRKLFARQPLAENRKYKSTLYKTGFET